MIRRISNVGANLVIITFILVFTPTLMAQADDNSIEEIEELDEIEDITSERLWNPKAFPILDRSVNVMTAHTVRKNAFLIVIDHRLREAFDESPFHDLLGFDAGGLKIGLGLRFGIFDNLDLGVYRLNGSVEVFDVYEFDTRYRILSQNTFPFDLAVRGGVTLFSQASSDDASGGFAQFLLTRQIQQRFTVGSGLLYHSNSSNDQKSLIDREHSVAIPLFVGIRITPRMMWEIETVANVSGYGSERPVFSSSVKFITHRHSFALLVTNTQYITADGIVSNTPYGFKDLTIGFFITREIQI
jgi:Membrane bound beta barrel domain (DUF5777)